MAIPRFHFSVVDRDSMFAMLAMHTEARYTVFSGGACFSPGPRKGNVADSHFGLGFVEATWRIVTSADVTICFF